MTTASASLALAILGGSTSTSNATTDPSVALMALRKASASGAEEKGVGQVAKQAEVKTAISRFTEAISRAKDVKTALSDPRVLTVLLPALGIPDGVDMPGLATRALTSDPDDKASVANKLAATDDRWLAAARTLDISSRGMDALRDPSVQKSLVEKYTAYEWRLSLDDQADGISDALYFQDRISSGKPLEVYEVLGDKALRRVVTGALGLPETIAIQEIETQAAAITSRINLAKLTDPKEATKLVERYVMNAAQDNANESGSSNYLLSLFA